MMNDFPSSKYDRGKIFAKAGLKAGTRYARHYLKSLRKRSEEETSKLHSQTAHEIFSEFTKLRGTALKIAQTLSIDHGYLPEEFAEVMTQAQYKAPPINRSLVRSIIKQELGAYPEMLFDSFNNEAIAAASIGQVHKATLKNGQEVAVKIQYPGVRDTISSDLSLAKSLFKRIIGRNNELDEYFNEIESTLRLETDYIHEGQAIRRFNSRFSGAGFKIPEWIKDYSTDRILTMSWLDGEHQNEFLDRSPSQDEINNYGQLLWDFFHLQIEQVDEIHADTHPGNFLLTPDNKLGVVDFGCVKKFPEDFFKNYMLLLPSHLNKDTDEIISLYKKLNVLKDDPFQNPEEMKYFEFCLNYGYTFAMPYAADQFDFGDQDYKDLIRGYTRNAPVGTELRGNKHFIYSTRVHLGLYHFLMKLGAVIDTTRSQKIVKNTIREI